MYIYIYVYTYIHISLMTQKRKNPPASAGDIRDAGLIPGSGRSPGVGNASPLQYSSLENSMNRGACQATVRGVAESDTTERSTLSL